MEKSECRDESRKIRVNFTYRRVVTLIKYKDDALNTLLTQYGVTSTALFIAFKAYRSLCLVILLQFGVLFVLMFSILCLLYLYAALIWRKKGKCTVAHTRLRSVGFRS